ncbi:MAG: cytochrome c oxidase subunit II [Candidatus Poribacteria bacterium]|nr:cytochrome c oxidase subunit II [Candidatus Poribacteria bacterium]MDE0502823.1 cytochrome c oxidase subunit II [Candidatus Poribacteria bacterium]
MLKWLDFPAWLPENASTFGEGVDKLFVLIYWITAVVFIAVMAVLIGFMIKYRFKEGRKADYIEGSTTLEITWTAATTVIVFGLAMLSLPQWNKIKVPSQFPSSPDDVLVRVHAKQFNWDMTYPGPDGKLGTTDDLTLENHLHVPVNKVVHVELTSEDVIHSFFVPQMRLKQDALPGRTINVWFEATKTGKYEIPCAELCGFGHSAMLGYLNVHTDDDYAKWVEEAWQ